jgi:hypothetical protein
MNNGTSLSTGLIEMTAFGRYQELNELYRIIVNPGASLA